MSVERKGILKFAGQDVTVLGNDLQAGQPAPEFTEDGHTRRSVPLTAETLRAADATMIVTDHSSLDYALIGREAKTVTDTRNALASRRA